MQALVSSGLSSTTQAAGLGKKFEEEVGAPARLQAQDISSQRLSGAEAQKAGFIERREDVGPDYATIASLAQSIGQAGGGGASRGASRVGQSAPWYLAYRGKGGRGKSPAMVSMAAQAARKDPFSGSKYRSVYG